MNSGRVQVIPQSVGVGKESITRHAVVMIIVFVADGFHLRVEVNLAVVTPT